MQAGGDMLKNPAAGQDHLVYFGSSERSSLRCGRTKYLENFSAPALCKQFGDEELLSLMTAATKTSNDHEELDNLWDVSQHQCMTS